MGETWICRKSDTRPTPVTVLAVLDHGVQIARVHRGQKVPRTHFVGWERWAGYYTRA